MLAPQVIDDRNFFTRLWSYLSFYLWTFYYWIRPSKLPKTEAQRLDYILDLVRETDKSGLDWYSTFIFQRQTHPTQMGFTDDQLIATLSRLTGEHRIVPKGKTYILGSAAHGFEGYSSIFFQFKDSSRIITIVALATIIGTLLAVLTQC